MHLQERKCCPLNFRSGFSGIWAFAAKLFDLMLLNLLFLVGCLPIVTVGASLSGMYYALFRFTDEEGSIVKDYCQGFRSDFWKSTAGWLLLLLIAAAAIENGYFLHVTNNLSTWIIILFTAVLFWDLAIGSHLFPLMAKFNNTFGKSLKNSMLLSLGHFPRTILLILLNNGLWALLLWDPSLFRSLVVVILLGGFSVPGYFSVLLLKKVFAPYLTPADSSEEETSVEAP